MTGKISVHLPTISQMKMEYELGKIEIEVPSETSLDPQGEKTLKKVKEHVFETVKPIMERWSSRGVHGSPEHVVLKNTDGVAVTDDRHLRESIQRSTEFSAVFAKELEKKCSVLN